MRPMHMAKIAVWLHVILVLVAVYYVTRIWNYTPLSAMPSPDTLVFSATALPPLLALWIGAWLAHGERAGRLLATGLIVALAVYAIAFLVVLGGGQDSMAPLFLILASLWQAGGLAVLLLGVWLVGRSERARVNTPQ